MTIQIFGQFEFVPFHTAYHFIKSVHNEEQLHQKFGKQFVLMRSTVPE